MREIFAILRAGGFRCLGFGLFEGKKKRFWKRGEKHEAKVSCPALKFCVPHTKGLQKLDDECIANAP